MTLSADLTAYPESGFNSYLDADTADESYFLARLNTDEWDAASETYREAALMQAFRTLQELDLSISFDEDGLIDSAVYSTAEAAAILEALQSAQCEQALHELKNDLDTPQTLDRISISGMVSMGFGRIDKPPARYAPRALSILRTWIKAPTINRYR